MRAFKIIALTVLVSATATSGVAIAGDALYLTPPLYREQARETQQVRRLSDLSTTPQPVAREVPSVVTRTVQMVADVETTAAH